MTYTTDELIKILDQELKENWKGKRVVLSSAQRINDPVVAKALNMDQVNKVFAIAISAAKFMSISSSIKFRV